MKEKLFEPLKYFEEEAAELHARNIHAYFNELVEKSGINADENRKTVKNYDEQTALAEGLEKKLKKYKAVRGLLIALMIIGIVVFALSFTMFSSNVFAAILMLILGSGAAAAAIFFWVKKINPIIKDTNAIREEHLKKAQEYLDLAYEQMRPLNNLFDDTDTLRLIEKTIPEIKFIKKFSKEHEKFLNDKHNFIDIMDEDSSVINTLAGTLCDNPFLFYRYKQHYEGTETYEGSLVIEWTETYRDSNGDLRTRTRTQTLYATVVKPKPFYRYSTSLGYGCQAAPDLSFSRESEHLEQLNDKQIAKKVKKGEKELQKQAKRALKEGGDFQEMANSEFDVLFGATDRDHEVQFRVMFTPLAQTNMVALLRSRIGFGDDFNFIKRGRYNLIQTDHGQEWDMNTNAENYQHYNIDVARERFSTFNNTFFKSVYFDFAPLMSVPAYLNSPVASMEAPAGAEGYFTYYEHEALANAIGEDVFAHEETATDVILKTQLAHTGNKHDDVIVTAHSFMAVERIDFVPVLGGDGYMHDVPVPWIEYIPVEKATVMTLDELDYSEKEFKEKPDTVSSLSAPWAYMHGILAHIK